MLQRVGRPGHAGGRKACSQHAGMRGTARVERLGHRAEVGDDAGTLRCTQRQGCCGVCGIQPAQACARSRSGDGSKHPGGMPALGVVLARLALRQFGPDFEARHVGAQHVSARGAEMLGFGDDRRHHRGTGVGRKRRVVEIQRMRRGAIDPGRLGGAGLAHTPEQRGISRSRRQRLGQNRHTGLILTGQHHAGGVDESQPGDFDGGRRDAVER